MRSFEQNRASALPTGASIAKYCETSNIPLEVTALPRTSATLHSISVDSNSQRVMFYLHGGAYINPLDTIGGLPVILDCARAAGAGELVCLEYTLAPELKYPGQLAQAAEGLEVLLQTHAPDQITLLGDSAGGHLALSLLAHLKKHHPNVPAVDLAGKKLAAAVLVSPWVAMTYTSKSFRENLKYDFLTQEVMTFATAAWAPDKTQVWGEPLVGGADFWNDVAVEKILITAGSWECFNDDILALASQLGAKPVGSNSKVELSVAEKEIHVQPAVDKAMGLSNGVMATDIFNFLEKGRGSGQ